MLLRLMLPAYLVKLWWRGRVEPLYRSAIGERFGRYGNAPRSAGWVWLHAVSLGETRAASALLQALRAQRPGMRLLLTHGTATGRAAGAALLRPGDAQAWLPFDTPGSTRRFFAHFHPAIGVLMETEVWPNLLHAARQVGVPMVLANARLSERSAHRGDTLNALMRPAAANLTLVLAQTQLDAKRMLAAGALRVEVSGNLKFDVTPDAMQSARGAAWRQAIGETTAHAPGRRIVLAASTREGEEALLLSAWQQLAAPRPLLLIVPRHPQRFDEVAERIDRSGFSQLRRSSWHDTAPPAARTVDVWLGDSIGEMATYFSCAEVALLGGSFEPLGGQNLIEAAACGCPVVMGPHTFNFAEAAELALREGAAQRVATMADAVQVAVRMAVRVTPDSGSATVTTTTTTTDTAMAAAASARARAFAARHGGAALRIAQHIEAVLAA